MLQRCGIGYLGFPLRLPVHRKHLSADAAATIIKNLAPPFFGVLITYLDRATEIAALCDALGAGIDFRTGVEDSGGRKSREVRKFLSERSFGGRRFPSCACLRSSKALSFLFHKSLKPMRFRNEVRLGGFICIEFCATGSRLASSVQA
jgi:hypothetical protein